MIERENVLGDGMQWRLISKTLLWVYHRNWVLDGIQVALAFGGVVAGAVAVWFLI